MLSCAFAKDSHRCSVPTSCCCPVPTFPCGQVYCRPRRMSYVPVLCREGTGCTSVGPSPGRHMWVASWAPPLGCRAARSGNFTRCWEAMGCSLPAPPGPVRKGGGRNIHPGRSDRYPTGGNTLLRNNFPRPQRSRFFVALGSPAITIQSMRGVFRVQIIYLT